MKIKKYQTAFGTDLETLDDAVNDKIKYGWNPIGGLIFNNENDHLCSGFSQALVKYEHESNPVIKQRKVVDVCHINQMPSIDNIISIRDGLINKGWFLIEQGNVEAYGWYLKMVKYEEDNVN